MRMETGLVNIEAVILPCSLLQRDGKQARCQLQDVTFVGDSRFAIGARRLNGKKYRLRQRETS